MTDADGYAWGFDIDADGYPVEPHGPRLPVSSLDAARDAVRRARQRDEIAEEVRAQRAARRNRRTDA